MRSVLEPHGLSRNLIGIRPSQRGLLSAIAAITSERLCYA